MPLSQSQEQILENLKYRIGKYVAVSKEIQRFEKESGLSKEALVTDKKFGILQNKLSTAKKQILEISPTASSRYTIEMLPNEAHKISEQMFKCIMEDVQTGKFHESEDLKPLDNLVTTIEIPKFKKKSDGTILTRDFEDEDGNIVKVAQLDGSDVERVAVLNGKPSEVVDTLKQMFINIKHTAQNTSFDSFEDDDEDPIQGLNNFFSKEEVTELIESLKTQIKSEMEQTVYKSLENPNTQQVINKQIATSYYTQMYNDYLDAFKEIHFDMKTGQPKTLLGQNLLQQVSYQQPNTDGSTSPVKGTLLQALELYTNKELVNAFSRYNADNNGILFTNTLGQNKQINKLFIEFIMNGMSIASSRLIGENPMLPKEIFAIDQKPANPFEEKQPIDGGLFQRFQTPGLLHSSLQGDAFNAATNLANPSLGQATLAQPAYNTLQQQPYNPMGVAMNPALQSAPAETPIYQPQTNNLVEDARQAVNSIVPDNQMVPIQQPVSLSFN